MKKSFITTGLTVAFIFALTGVFAKTNYSDIKDYVVTDNGITYVQKLRNGFKNNLVGITGTGEKICFNKSEVKVFRKNGREFKRLYLVEEGTNYVKSVFLERIYTRAGYSIYKKMYTDSEQISLNDLYVYHGEKLELQLNQENHRVVLSFFFPRFNMLFAS